MISILIVHPSHHSWHPLYHTQVTMPINYSLPSRPNPTASPVANHHRLVESVEKHQMSWPVQVMTHVGRTSHKPTTSRMLDATNASPAIGKAEDHSNLLAADCDHSHSTGMSPTIVDTIELDITVKTPRLIYLTVASVYDSFCRWVGAVTENCLKFLKGLWSRHRNSTCDVLRSFPSDLASMLLGLNPDTAHSASLLSKHNKTHEISFNELFPNLGSLLTCPLLASRYLLDECCARPFLPTQHGPFSAPWIGVTWVTAKS
jgi:hypothetical protein